MTAPYNAYKIIHSELALIIVIGSYEPYHDISSVFISNKTVSGAGKLCWSTTPASRYTGGVEPNGLSSNSLFLSSDRIAQ